MKTFKQMYYEGGHTALQKLILLRKRELERLNNKT